MSSRAAPADTDRPAPPAEAPGRRRFLGTVVAAAVTAALPATAHAAPRGPRRLFLGTYTSVAGGGAGIGLAAYDDTTGHITATGTVTGVGDPSFLALHPPAARSTR